MLEIGFAGIHAPPLELAGWEVVVAEPDPAFRARAEARAGLVIDEPEGTFDAVIAPAGARLEGIAATRVVLVDDRGRASIRE